jgi:hypothetical protein
LIHKEILYGPSLPVWKEWRRSVDGAISRCSTAPSGETKNSSPGGGKTARMGTSSAATGFFGNPSAWKTRRVLIHINNTNPVLNESPEHRAVRGG